MPIWTGIKAGSQLRARLTGAMYVAEEMLGEGGQGQVWMVRAPQGSAFALKWYFPTTATEDQLAALRELVSRGSPDARFLWPLDLVEDSEGFGYLMEVRAPRFYSMMDIMQRSVDPSFRALTTAALEMADAFLQLHASGLCYLDISFGNVFLDPASGGILICDNDNVRIDGRPAGIAGTPKFMAPEVIVDLMAGRFPTPNRTTDLFSLAVLFFYMFCMHHPFEGAREAAIGCFDIAEQNQLYGEDPVFIFHPDDLSNRPDPKLHPNPLIFWPLYPGFIRDLFVRAFTVGVTDPDERVQESEWRLAMSRLRDSIAACPSCLAENFFTGDAGATCWNCGHVMGSVPRLELGEGGRGGLVVLNAGTELHPHHTERRRYDFSTATAQVVAHPQRPDVWGLRNLTARSWAAQTTDGKEWTVEPGRSVRIAADTVIDLGSVQARIVGDRPVAGAATG